MKRPTTGIKRPATGIKRKAKVVVVVEGEVVEAVEEVDEEEVEAAQQEAIYLHITWESERGLARESALALAKV